MASDFQRLVAWGVSTRMEGRSLRVFLKRNSIQGVARMEAKEYKIEAGMERRDGQW